MLLLSFFPYFFSVSPQIFRFLLLQLLSSKSVVVYFIFESEGKKGICHFCAQLLQACSFSSPWDFTVPLFSFLEVISSAVKLARKISSFTSDGFMGFCSFLIPRPNLVGALVSSS